MRLPALYSRSSSLGFIVLDSSISYSRDASHGQSPRSRQRLTQLESPTSRAQRSSSSHAGIGRSRCAGSSLLISKTPQLAQSACKCRTQCHLRPIAPELPLDIIESSPTDQSRWLSGLDRRCRVLQTSRLFHAPGSRITAEHVERNGRRNPRKSAPIDELGDCGRPSHTRFDRQSVASSGHEELSLNEGARRCSESGSPR
jgi:hypothetical protein